MNFCQQQIYYVAPMKAQDSGMDQHVSQTDIMLEHHKRWL